jgi:hypothetical protein
MSFASVPWPDGLVRSHHPSNVPDVEEGFIHSYGVLHIFDTSSEFSTYNFWLKDLALWSITTTKLSTLGYDVFRYTPYLSPDRWENA